MKMSLRRVGQREGGGFLSPASFCLKDGNTVGEGRPRRGVAIPVVVVTISVLFLTFFGLFVLIQGVGEQREYSDAHIRALNIAESGYNLLVARLMLNPWEDRWFAGGPDAKASLSYGGGEWDYFIQDTPGEERSADLWVRATFKGTRRLLFYRVRYKDLLFKSLSRPNPRFAGSADEQMPPALTPANLDPLTAEMNRRIAQREKNRVEVTRKWRELSQKMDPIEILKTLGAHLDGDVLDRSLADGVSTEVPKPPKDRPPPGTKAYLEKIEKTERLAAYFAGSVLLARDYIQSAIIPVINEINKTVSECYKKEKYQQAELIYREFLNYVFSVKIGVNLSELELRLQYYRDLAALAMNCNAKDFDRLAAQLRERLSVSVAALPPLLVATPTLPLGP